MCLTEGSERTDRKARELSKALAVHRVHHRISAVRCVWKKNEEEKEECEYFFVAVKEERRREVVKKVVEETLEGRPHRLEFLERPIPKTVFTNTKVEKPIKAGNLLVEGFVAMDGKLRTTSEKSLWVTIVKNKAVLFSTRQEIVELEAALCTKKDEKWEEKEEPPRIFFARGRAAVDLLLHRGEKGESVSPWRFAFHPLFEDLRGTPTFHYLPRNGELGALLFHLEAEGRKLKVVVKNEVPMVFEPGVHGEPPTSEMTRLLWLTEEHGFFSSPDGKFLVPARKVLEFVEKCEVARCSEVRFSDGYGVPTVVCYEGGESGYEKMLQGKN